MKILHLINSVKPGGAETVMSNYIRVCNELGHNSVVIGARNSESYELQLRPIAEIEYSLSQSLLKDADVIFVHSNINLLRLIRFFPLLRKRRIRIYYILHLCFSQNKFRILSYLINKICTGFIQITPIIEEEVKKYIKLPVFYINNFYINKYTKDQWPEIRQVIRKELGISPATTLICFSAIFKPGKGLKDIVDLAASMRNDTGVHFLVVGDGQEAYRLDGYPYKNLTWVGRQTDVEKYLVASDAYIFTSRFAKEMMPMALIEAINSDKQIYAYDTDINRHLLGNSVFQKIDSGVLLDGLAANGRQLKHYDKEYGIERLRNLLVP